jgi:hypothetical protein
VWSEVLISVMKAPLLHRREKLKESVPFYTDRGFGLCILHDGGLWAAERTHYVFGSLYERHMSEMP